MNLADQSHQDGAQEAPFSIVGAPSLFTPAFVLDNKPTRAQIERFEAQNLQRPQVELPLRHYFTPGLYAREMFIPKGTVLTGAVHKTEHLSVFVGDITVWTEEGMRRLTGAHTLTSKPGAKRVGYAHEDTYCTGFFPNPDDETDVFELETRLCESPERLQNNRSDLHFVTHEED